MATDPTAEAAGTSPRIGSVRARLLLTLTLALSPILILAGFRAVLDAEAGRESRRQELTIASSTLVDQLEDYLQRAQVMSAVFAPELTAGNCRTVYDRVKPVLPVLYAVTIFDASGSATCTTSSAGPGARMANEDWMRRLGEGEQLIMTSSFDSPRATGSFYAFIRRLENAKGDFIGASSLSVRLEDLAEAPHEWEAPEGVEVAIVAENGKVFHSRRFAQVNPDLLKASLVGPKLNILEDQSRKTYDVVLSSLRPNGAWAMLSRPSPGPLSYFILRPLTTLGTPLLAFTIALVAAWIAIDKLVLTWLYRLQRRAAAYGAGHYKFRDNKTAENSPREIADLASSLDMMAERISERDVSQRKLVKAREDAVREIHHRVKNNLQIVTSFLSLQSRQVQDPAAKDALASARFRIDALSAVHQTLYQHERLETVKIQPFLEGLLAHMAGALGLEDLNVNMHWSIDDAELPSDSAIPLALFTVEAVTNAAKYGFQRPGLDEGEIDVTFRAHPERFVLRIADNGAGAGADSFDRRPESTGLGRRLMIAFARQLHGEKTVSTEKGKGYIVTLAIPRTEAPPRLDADPADTNAEGEPAAEIAK